MSENGKKVRIVTDSTNCLPPEIIERYDIRVVPVGLIIEGKLYRDNLDISLDEILQHLHTAEEEPSTSAGNPSDFLDTFTEIAQTTDNILCILVTRAMTATQESAYQARRMLQPKMPNLNIEILDSKTSAGAMGFIITEAARAAEEGKSLAEVTAVARSMINRVVYLSSIETLKYLIKLGRAPKSMTSIGEFFKVRPIIGLVDDTGWIQVVARVRGTLKALEKVTSLISDYVETDRPLHAMIHYSNSMEDAERLREMVAKRYRCDDIIITPYSSVMVCSTGPMTGISFYTD